MTISSIELQDTECDKTTKQSLFYPEPASPNSRVQNPVPTSSWLNTSSPDPILSNDLELSVPVLKTIRVGLTIIQHLGALESMYDLSAKWTMSGASYSNLPPSFYPTQTQLLVPHHPLLDIIPWPSLRTKLILMYAMPAHLRPPNARAADSLLQISNDIDDPAEGFVVNGPDGMDADDWEIGGPFLRNWWWAVDGVFIAKTNKSRVRRGVPRLRFVEGV
jgi:hypothetical protein